MAKMSWEELEEKAKNIGGGTFIQLKQDKDKVVGVFVGDPNAREVIWDPSKNATVPFTEEHAKKGEKASLKIKFNFALFKEGNGEDVKDLAVPVMKIIELNAMTFNQLVKARKKYGLDRMMFEVERSGKKGDNKTSYSVLSDDELTDAHRAQIAALKLHNLEDHNDDDEDFETYGKDGKEKDGKGKSEKKEKAVDKPAAEKAADKQKAPPADESPIDPEVAQQLVGRLKPLDRELGVNKFLSKFGIAKIKELKKKDFAEADAFIKALETPAEEPPAAPAEVDPFAE